MIQNRFFIVFLFIFSLSLSGWAYDEIEVSKAEDLLKSTQAPLANLEGEPSVNIPDGRKIHYVFKVYHGRQGHDTQKDRVVLIHAASPNAPHEAYTYEDPCLDYLERIIRKDRPEGRSLCIDYHKTNHGFHKGKVKCLKAPAGSDQTPIPIYTFEYRALGEYKNKKRECFAETTVRNGLNHQTIYGYSLEDHRL